MTPTQIGVPVKFKKQKTANPYVSYIVTWTQCGKQCVGGFGDEMSEVACR